MTANRLEMNNINLAFSGFRALSNVAFTLRGGSVHALTGANGAGKSTLMAVLCGTHAHYEGEIVINNQPVSVRSPRDAKQLGIHLVQQEVDVALVPGLSIAENIMLDRLAEPGLGFSWRAVREQAREALAQLDITLDVRRPIDSCTLAEKQQILLARALSHHCRFLILDEPTAPLDQHESERLFTVVRRLQQQGIGVVFISHRIHELKAICDTLTVLRDGKLIESSPMNDLSGEQIVEKMLGHELSDIFPPQRPPHGEEILLQVDGLHDEGLLQDISLRLRKGEILGIAGLAGAGKTELCKALFGASKSRLTRGELNSQPWRPRDPADSVLRGLALVPEERRKEGIFIEEAIGMNLAVSADNSFSRWSLFGHRQAWRWAEEVIARIGIRTTGPAQTLRRLSGGNQQKVAIGKWLRGNANVLIFDEPTKGVDVKAKTDLFTLIDGLARDGKGIIYASGEFSELVGLCDRICVLWDGRIVAEIPGAEAREETLLYYSTGGAAA
ncbi:TPA: sugar ABC transporter ATP-binding protein [Raoultella planticola]|mgnify:FL=1|uniref:Sugar ABC transporter ATP-binding protein n=1 Tax=Raoultella planticola TaxID=575 RepID=A0A443VQT3_RAOPL|nr:sugar ABC transporter ATP-binding protein [Raoultella planticola]EKW3526300.1 sugar ABC transporter ATP-binding protein [Raoultella planticola]ELC3571256.1 sugar ABC transporter ATP-binding protein [Raoultella planticola]ELF4968928.1 sugar ABC transporter ATP-binding protein [Raoultella planticola]ELH7934404.1 sugar ABC transporter ATP-binding protein [Raoultella planticola]ELN0131152.1 sugar ABC transporter ATP-binding protein [Raoultella planticola]